MLTIRNVITVHAYRKSGFDGKILMIVTCVLWLSDGRLLEKVDSKLHHSQLLSV